MKTTRNVGSIKSRKKTSCEFESARAVEFRSSRKLRFFMKIRRLFAGETRVRECMSVRSFHGDLTRLLALAIAHGQRSELAHATFTCRVNAVTPRARVLGTCTSLDNSILSLLRAESCFMLVLRARARALAVLSLVRYREQVLFQLERSSRIPS